MKSVITFSQYYLEKDKKRNQELLTCIENNLKNTSIDKVILLVEGKPKLPTHKRLEIIRVKDRPTYQDLLEAANFYGKGAIAIIHNTDIYFDKENILKIKSLNLHERVLALSRWDVQLKGEPVLYSHPDSQDTWVFETPMRHLKYSDFYPGTRGCDNRIAFEFQQAGYEVLNPAISIKTYHLHLTEKRNYSTEKNEDMVHRPYTLPHLTSIDEGRPKKIMHVALNPPGDKQIALPRMLRTMGDYYEFDWNIHKDRIGVEAMRKKLVEENHSYDPDFVFMQIQTADVLDQHTVYALKGKVINWTGDVRHPIPQWYLDLGRCIESTCFTNEYDARQMRKMGLPSHYLQIGFDDKIYSPKGEKIEAPEIVFMANHYGGFPLSDFRQEIVKRLKERYGDRFGVYGTGWPDAENYNSHHSYEALIYRSCKIAINCSHFEYDRYSSDRIFRIMGSGAMCLTKWFPEIEKDYNVGEHLDVFDNLDAMCTKVDYYLKHTKERKEVAKAGTKFVRENHTWENRVQDIYDIIEVTSPRQAPDMPVTGAVKAMASRGKREHVVQQRIQLAKSEKDSYLLSILIPTIDEREFSYVKLTTELNKQIIKHKLHKQIEIVANKDNKEKSIGLKRNELMKMAKGKYVVYFDDDDWPHPKYIELIYQALMDNLDVDCVTFEAKVTFDGENEQQYKFSIDTKSYYSSDSIFYRPPGHLTPIKKEIAEKFKFHELPKHSDQGSDVHWSLDMVKKKALKTSTHIEECLYHYQYIQGKER